MNLTARQKLTFGRRLGRLYALLGDIKPSQYAHEAFLRKYDPKHVGCGTVACTLGWAVASKRFRGLKIKPFQFHDGTWTITAGNPNDDVGIIADKYFGADAYNRIFDVYAFGYCANGEVTPMRVRERIREFAKDEFGFTIPA